MATITMEQILQRVQELKHEASEKDEVICEQQRQIFEADSKIKAAEERCIELECRIDELNAIVEKAEAHAREAQERCAEMEQKVAELSSTANQAEELMDKLNDLLG